MQGLFKMMDSKNCPFVALSRTFRAQPEKGQGSIIVDWSACFVPRVYMGFANKETSLVMRMGKRKHSTKSFYRLPDNGSAI